MPTSNKNSNTQNNNNKQIVHVTVNNVAPRRKRAPSKPRETDAGSPAPPVNVYSPSVYVPHQSTSVGGTGEPPSYFNTATTNQDAYLHSVAQNHMAQQAHQSFMDQYTQASIPGLSAGIPNQTASLTPEHESVPELTVSPILSEYPESVSSHNSIHQPESEHLATPRSTHMEHHDVAFNPYKTHENPMYNTTPTTPLHVKFDEAAGPSHQMTQTDPPPIKIIHGVDEETYNGVIKQKIGEHVSGDLHPELLKIAHDMKIPVYDTMLPHILHDAIKKQHGIEHKKQKAKKTEE